MQYASSQTDLDLIFLSNTVFSINVVFWVERFAVENKVVQGAVLYGNSESSSGDSFSQVLAFQLN